MTEPMSNEKREELFRIVKKALMKADDLDAFGAFLDLQNDAEAYRRQVDAIAHIVSGGRGR